MRCDVNKYCLSSLNVNFEGVEHTLIERLYALSNAHLLHFSTGLLIHFNYQLTNDRSSIIAWYVLTHLVVGPLRKVKAKAVCHCLIAYSFLVTLTHRPLN